LEEMDHEYMKLKKGDIQGNRFYEGDFALNFDEKKNHSN
jgi:hypothetical protein